MSFPEKKIERPHVHAMLSVHIISWLGHDKMLLVLMYVTVVEVHMRDMLDRRA